MANETTETAAGNASPPIGSTHPGNPSTETPAKNPPAVKRRRLLLGAIGVPGSAGRPGLRHSLGSASPQHRFDRRRLRERPRHLRRAPGGGPGSPGAGGRQQPRAQGRPSRRARQGALSARRRPGAGGGGHGTGRPGGGERGGARSRGAGAEPALEAPARRAERRQPGRAPARPGRRSRQEQGHAEAGPGRVRPGKAAGRASVVSREEFDRREAALSVARAEVTQALDNVQSGSRLPRAAGAAHGRRRASPRCPPISTRPSPRSCQAQAELDSERRSARRHRIPTTRPRRRCSTAFESPGRPRPRLRPARARTPPASSRPRPS